MLSHVLGAVDKTSSSFSAHGKIGNFIIIINIRLFVCIVISATMLWYHRGSLQLHLRCLIHMELAKCEEDVEHIAVAVEHIKKVCHLA